MAMLATRVGIQDAPEAFKGKRVLVRVDYNVPIKDGKVTDETRIKATVDTIDFLFKSGAKCLILMSHCGRPDGQKMEKYTLRPVVEPLQDLIKRSVTFLSDCVGDEVEAACKDPAEGSVILLENLRFHIEEEGKGKDADGNVVTATEAQVKKFRESLTLLGDVYVNDAFGTAHRAHSSMVGVAHDKRYAGLLLKKECEYFSKALESPNRPFLGILGGAKVKDKIQLIESLLSVVDVLIIGGGMAFTFLKVLNNMPIGNSIYDEEGAKIVPQIMEKAKAKGVAIHFPVDFKCQNTSAKSNPPTVVTAEEGIRDGLDGMDSGPQSIAKFKSVIESAKQIIWNGPPGVFEMEEFSGASKAFVDIIAEQTPKGTITIIGGGDTAALVTKCGKEAEMSHVSTGGGAALELLEGKQLPGILAITSSKD